MRASETEPQIDNSLSQLVDLTQDSAKKQLKEKRMLKKGPKNLRRRIKAMHLRRNGEHFC
jgi:hypothetical protein